MYYLISLLPIVIYLAVLKGLDGFSLTRWNRLAECFLWGLVACLICLWTVSSPLIEELLKAAPLLVAIKRKRSAFMSECILYGAAIGAGFAFLENILYISLGDYFTLGDALTRGFGTSILHIGCTALTACVAMMLCRISFQWKEVFKILILVPSLIPSVLLHSLYNLFLIPEFLQMAVTVCVVAAMILLIHEIDEKLIRKWLDKCISNDISLFKSIREGTLGETHAGKYLKRTKEHFKPEVFFDICVYLGLYLELSIAAKSRMILKESGMDFPLTTQEHNDYRDKLTECSILRKNIGKAGLRVIAPLVDSKAVDDWSMKELL